MSRYRSNDLKVGRAFIEKSLDVVRQVIRMQTLPFA
ncbi:hypothetical protein FHS21_004093 [Phyllobacterium trifolii]|uniref:Uncharacterized protein n=1 Tax=Phyllobacterium trifolii TaxID=300193 RepID=A0A839UGL6_9HYPH|nr:hypothetical protein [Phyllobacterium trifolii]